MSTIEIGKTEYRDLCAAYRTLDSYVNIRCLCPKCKEFFILEGFVCIGCGYDITADAEDEE